LSNGVRGLSVRIARYVNDLLNRHGAFWADRWHGRALRSPREARNVILYVLANFRKHASHGLKAGIDPFSSGIWFDGWHEWSPSAGVPPPLAEAAPDIADYATVGDSFTPRSWLAARGWRQHALLGISERPRSSARPRAKKVSLSRHAVRPSR
jgi:hypothetical protein